MTVKHFPHNKLGKDYIVGDLHGHIDALFDVLAKVRFNPDTDRVFSTGDLIDRGPHNLECLDLLEQPWFHSVKGNHEQFMEWSEHDLVRASWIANGGVWAITHLHADHFAGYKDMVTHLPTAIVVGTGKHRFNIIHAQPPDNEGIITDKVFDATPIPDLEEYTLWGRELFHYPDQFKFDKGLSTTYVGHSPTTLLVRAGPIYYLDRNTHRSYMDPDCCIALACHTDRVIYEYYPPTGVLVTTKHHDVSDMAHPDFEEDYVAFQRKASPPA